MARIDKDLFNELGEIVGDDYAECSAPILDAYAYQFLSQMVTGGSPWIHRPLAVVLPGNEREVQAIVKVANKYKVHYKAHSTGWGFYSAAGKDDVVLIDLRRMNRIIDIDERNMIAVIEPYVNGVELSREANRHGLCNHIVGAGGNASVLASVTSMMGQGWTGIYTSFNNRNLMGCEWVMPDGELVTMGSAGSTGDWFSANGPGVGLRGVFRGFAGALGGLGVFTKAAAKLYHWNGPEEVKLKGKSPDYHADIPERMGMYLISWPDWESAEAGFYRMGEAEIGYALCRNAPAGVCAAATTSNAEFAELWETGIAQTHPNLANFILHGASERELKFNEECLHRILDETNGKIFLTNRLSPYYVKSLAKFMGSTVNQLGTRKSAAGFYKFARQLRKLMVGKGPNFMNEMLWLATVRTSLTARGAFRFGGSFWTTFGAVVTPACAAESGRRGTELKKKYIENGKFVDDGADNGWWCSYENSHMAHLEELAAYDPADPHSSSGVSEYVKDSIEISCKEALGVNMNTAGNVMNAMTGMVTSGYDRYLREIKKRLDPNDAADGSSYVENHPPTRQEFDELESPQALPVPPERV